MLGYRFEVRSLHSVAEAKRLLRKGMKPWFHIKDCPRGWIAGPFLCLWMSAFSRQGPMVLARITQDGFGSKISGRAGADLNGTLLFLLMLPAMLVLLFMMHQSGQGTARTYAVTAIAFGIGLPFTLWFNFRSRSEADPLVRFIRKTVENEAGRTAKRSGTRTPNSAPVPTARMEVGGIEAGYPPSEKAVYDALVGLESGGFVTLSFGRETYMQTALEYDRFILERREGDNRSHWRLKKPLELEEVADAMRDYLEGHSGIDDAKWQRIRM